MKTLSLILLLAFSCFAQKDRWVTLTASIENDKIEAVYHLDTESVERKGDEIQFWLKRVATAPKDKVGHALILYIVNCPAKTLRNPQMIEYAKGGSVLDAFEWPNAKAAIVIPGSLGEGVLKKMCARY